MVRMFVMIKSPTSSKMVHVRSKTRSRVQILEKPCVHSRGHIFSQIILKPGQNVCLDEKTMSSKMVHVRSKTSSQGQILEKPRNL